MTWHVTPGYYPNTSLIKEICNTHFGPEQKSKININGIRADNHGNWRITTEKSIQFRYKRDITIFLLLAGHLAEEPPRSLHHRYRYPN